METVAFYSYKGGVGRTLLVANTAQFLAMSGHKVVALDLDLEAPGLHHKLGNPEVLKRAVSGKLRGAVDELLSVFEDDSGMSNLRESGIDVTLPTGSIGSLCLIPAGSAPSHSYWASLERLNNSLRSGSRNGGLLEAVLELQARIAKEFDPDYLLIDSRTGITELGGMATSILADRVVCLTTTAPESVEGTRVVADALRASPRLSSQNPLRIEFLITRAASGTGRSNNISRIEKELGNSVTVLPQDAGIAKEERVYANWRPGQPDSSEDDETGKELFSATLKWIAESFPGHKEGADRARSRMEGIHRVWQQLTSTSQRVEGGTRYREAWPVEQLREHVKFGSGNKSRQADIVVYDSVPEHSKAKPLMIVEYVAEQEQEATARWWLEGKFSPVVAIITDKRSERCFYSRKKNSDYNSLQVHHSGRWDFPLPHDFKILSDPTDVSIESLLGAVRRGHPEYLERIITEWGHCSLVGIHGGVPWKPQLAKKIIDELARVDDHELARKVLWAASTYSHPHRMRVHDFDEGHDDQMQSELFAPLCWRLPPEASVAILREHGSKMGPARGMHVIALLAHDLLGLHYDPDATFRKEARRKLDRSDNEFKSENDYGIEHLRDAFRHTEITFEISADIPPLAVAASKSKNYEKSKALSSIVTKRIANDSLITTGLLGDYQAENGKVLLYRETISACAERLGLRDRHVGSVTLIHETLHALAHLGRDLDGRMWQEFALPDAKSPFFEPSWFHETLTQYFTYQHIIRLQDPELLNAFEVMSSKQTPEYQAWKRFRDFPLEDMRNWFMSVRRGLGSGAPFSNLLYNPNRSES